MLEKILMGSGDAKPSSPADPVMVEKFKQITDAPSAALKVGERPTGSEIQAVTSLRGREVEV